MKNTTLIYHEWAELFEEMPAEDVKTVILALLRYDETGDVPKVSFENKLVNAIFKTMLQKTANNRSLYFEKCEKNAKNGALGGRPKKTENQTVSTENPKKPERIGREGKGKEGKGKEKKGVEEEAHTPSLADIRSFCSDEGLRFINTEKFFNYYESQGWLIDGELMDWQARARYWNAQDTPKQTEFQNFSQRKYDFATLEKELLSK